MADGRRRGAQTGPSRAEIGTTVVVVLLVALGVFALWPRNATDAAGSPPGATERTALDVPDAELTALRAAAALDPCPPATDAAPIGPLAGITVPCLGAPGAAAVGAGRPVLLNVWASWCAPCRAELPVLAEYAARPGAVPVLGIDVLDDPRAALALLTDIGVRLPSVTDPDNALRIALDIPPGLPMSYLVRADGSVARVDPPIPFATADDVAAVVAELA